MVNEPPTTGDAPAQPQTNTAGQPPTDKPATPPKADIKEVEFEGYKFNVNFDVIDDVENIEIIDKIENQNNVVAIIDFLKSMIGHGQYEIMKEYFVKKDGKFKISKLTGIYQAIFDKFDPKDSPS